MGQEWESEFRIPLQRIVSQELLLPCRSAELASLLTCSFVRLQDGINIRMGTTVMMGTPSALRGQDSPMAPRSPLEM